VVDLPIIVHLHDLVEDLLLVVEDSTAHEVDDEVDEDDDN